MGNKEAHKLVAIQPLPSDCEAVAACLWRAGPRRAGAGRHTPDRLGCSSRGTATHSSRVVSLCAEITAAAAA